MITNPQKKKEEKGNKPKKELKQGDCQHYSSHENQEPVREKQKTPKQYNPT